MAFSSLLPFLSQLSSLPSTHSFVVPFPSLSLALSITLSFLPPSQIGQQVVPKEIALLHSLSHKYVIKLLDYFEDTEQFYIIMERPTKYIDLFDYISQKKVMSERSARFIFRQVLEAVQYCLSMGVMHRDMKDENILIDLQTNQIKLIDFGSGTFVKDGIYTEYEGEVAIRSVFTHTAFRVSSLTQCLFSEGFWCHYASGPMTFWIVCLVFMLRLCRMSAFV